MSNAKTNFMLDTLTPTVQNWRKTVDVTARLVEEIADKLADGELGEPFNSQLRQCGPVMAEIATTADRARELVEQLQRVQRALWAYGALAPATEK